MIITAIDHITGYELVFSVFYLMPIVLATWYVGQRQGITMCVLSAAAWLLIDFTSGHSYSHAIIPIWNTMVRFCFFIITSQLLTKIKHQLQIEETSAKTDSLTGTLNRRAFSEATNTMLALASRHNRPIILAYIDLDNFKQLNDTYGHNTGDHVLKILGNTLLNTIRATDIASRLGGDEFAMLLPGTFEMGGGLFLKKFVSSLLSKPKIITGFLA